MTSNFLEPIILILRNKYTLRLLIRYKLTIILATTGLLILDLPSKYNRVRIYLVIIYLLLPISFTVARDIIVSTEVLGKIDLIYFLSITVIVYLVST